MAEAVVETVAEHPELVARDAGSVVVAQQVAVVPVVEKDRALLKGNILDTRYQILDIRYW